MRCTGTRWLSCAFASHAPQVLKVGLTPIQLNIACTSRLLSYQSLVSRTFVSEAGACDSEGLTRADLSLRFPAHHRFTFPLQRISHHDHSRYRQKSLGHTSISSLRLISCCAFVANKPAEKLNNEGLSASYWAAQTEAPITGRKRALVINETQEVDLGERAWHALLHRGVEVLPDHHEQTRRCDEIGKSIVHALELILPQHRGREWLFSVARSANSEIEAYSMAPGFVVVSQGLMQMCTSDAELAFVLAHEVAHVVARHVSERQSRYALWGTLVQSLEQSLGISSDRQVLDLLLHLPLSRELESEADEIALVLMSKACYNPQAASRVFAKMQSQKRAALDWGHHWSTHPSFEVRTSRVEEHVSRTNPEV